MTKTSVMLFTLFVVAFAAGVSSALVAREWKAPEKQHGSSWISNELGLDSAQREEMIKIWSGVGRGNWQEEGDRRRALQKQRDEAVRALVPEEKQAELTQIYEAYSKQTAELSEQRRKSFDAAVEKTKAILTPEQRSKYEEILARRAEGRRGPGGPGDGSPRTFGGPTTRPNDSTPKPETP